MEGTAGFAKNLKDERCWRSFKPGAWCSGIDVRDFIVRNVDALRGRRKHSWPARPQRTKAVWAKLQPYFQEEQKKGVLDVDAKTPSTLLAHKAGYIDRDNEVIVGLQTDQPFKRAIFPYGGLRMVEAGLKAAGFEADPQVHEAFTKYRKTHNDGVFDAYTPEIMSCRKSGIITGLPDAYGRGRIIGDYRRVALYGVDRLIEAKQAERAQIDDMWPTDEVIRHARGAGRADPRAGGPRGDGEALRLRHQRGRRRTRTRRCSGPISPISARSRKRTARRCRSAASRASSTSTSSATSRKATLDESRRAGALGPAGAEAAHRALPAHAGLRRAVQRRSLLGDRMRRRHGPGRPAAGHQEQLSHAAHADQSRPGAGAEHHGAVVEASARQLQALLHQGQPARRRRCNTRTTT